MSRYKTFAPAVALTLLLTFAGPVYANSTVTPATPTITEFSGGLSANAAPLGLVSGPEGDVWFTQSATAAIDRMTLPGGISSYTAGSEPVAITLGPDGRIWFAESGATPKFGALEPAFGLLQEYPQTASSKVAGMTSGPEGDVWFTDEASSNSYVGRIVPATGAITEYKLPTAGSAPSSITVGPEGALWFTEEKSGYVGKFTPSTGVPVEYQNGITPKNNPAGITTGPEGDIWFTEASKEPKIARINPVTAEVTQFSTGLTAGPPEGIVTGSDGNLYFTEAGGAIGQITPKGAITEFKIGLSEKAEPWSITSGPDGNIWFTEKAKPARIGRLTVAPSIGAPQASEVTRTSATLTARIGANAQPTNYFVEYGPTPSYGTVAPTRVLGSSGTPVIGSQPLSGLSAGATYHFRFIAYNATGTTYGQDATFTTRVTEEAAPVTPLTPPIFAGLGPGPVIGTESGAAPTSGTILVQGPTGGFVALTGQQTIPLGTIIDATHGTIRLLTALNKTGKTQAVTVWGGVFSINQAKTGLTRIYLKGGLSCKRGKAASAASKKKAAAPKRTLWAKDNHGLYSTYGANTVATVRGTEWETVDSCAGTLTKVLQGSVSVRKVHTHRTVLVRAGHSYLGRP